MGCVPALFLKSGSPCSDTSSAEKEHEYVTGSVIGAPHDATSPSGLIR